MEDYNLMIEVHHTFNIFSLKEKLYIMFQYNIIFLYQ